MPVQIRMIMILTKGVKMKQQAEKKLQANLKAINNGFNTVIFADIEVKFKLMELEAIRILIDDCERLINEDAGE